MFLFQFKKKKATREADVSNTNHVNSFDLSFFWEELDPAHKGNKTTPLRKIKREWGNPNLSKHCIFMTPLLDVYEDQARSFFLAQMVRRAFLPLKTCVLSGSKWVRAEPCLMSGPGHHKPREPTLTSLPENGNGLLMTSYLPWLPAAAMKTVLLVGTPFCLTQNAASRAVDLKHSLWWLMSQPDVAF